MEEMQIEEWPHHGRMDNLDLIAEEMRNVQPFQRIEVTACCYGIWHERNVRIHSTRRMMERKSSRPLTMPFRKEYALASSARGAAQRLLGVIGVEGSSIRL